MGSCNYGALLGIKDLVRVKGSHDELGIVADRFDTPRAMTRKTQIVLCDQKPLIRAGLRTVLENDGRIEIVGEATNASGAVTTVKLNRPQVVVMDVDLPGCPAVELVRSLSSDDGHAPFAVLLLAATIRDDLLLNLLQAGAQGFLYHGATVDELVHAIEMIASGNALLSPRAIRMVLDSLRRSPVIVKRHSPELASLTRREREILGLIAKGWSNARIARWLSLGEATVKSHVYHMRRKLNLEDRAQTVMFAYEHGVVDRGC